MLISSFSFSQTPPSLTGTLRGTVIDAQTKKILEKVVIEVLLTDSTVRKVVSNEDGRYEISSLRPGKYAIKASLAGHGPVKIESIMIIADEDRFVNFSMNAGSVKLIKFKCSPALIDRQRF